RHVYGDTCRDPWVHGSDDAVKRATVDQGKGSVQPVEPHHTPVNPISSTS
ncbi:hypothetical protein Tco_1481113, partial [Tanacetum coccineum]